MKVELDCRPVNNDNPKPFFAIRLYPENNKDITDMKWGLTVMGKIEKIIEAGLTYNFHHVVTFKDKKS